MDFVRLQSSDRALHWWHRTVLSGAVGRVFGISSQTTDRRPIPTATMEQSVWRIRRLEQCPGHVRAIPNYYAPVSERSCYSIVAS